MTSLNCHNSAQDDSCMKCVLIDMKCVLIYMKCVLIKLVWDTPATWLTAAHNLFQIMQYELNTFRKIIYKRMYLQKFKYTGVYTPDDTHIVIYTRIYRVPQNKLWLRKSLNCTLFLPFIGISPNSFYCILIPHTREEKWVVTLFWRLRFSWDIQVYIGVVWL